MHTNALIMVEMLLYGVLSLVSFLLFYYLIGEGKKVKDLKTF